MKRFKSDWTMFFLSLTISMFHSQAAKIQGFFSIWCCNTWNSTTSVVRLGYFIRISRLNTRKQPNSSSEHSTGCRISWRNSGAACRWEARPTCQTTSYTGIPGTRTSATSGCAPCRSARKSSILAIIHLIFTNIKCCKRIYTSSLDAGIKITVAVAKLSA